MTKLELIERNYNKYPLLSELEPKLGQHELNPPLIQMLNNLQVYCRNLVRRKFCSCSKIIIRYCSIKFQLLLEIHNLRFINQSNHNDIYNFSMKRVQFEKKLKRIISDRVNFIKQKS
ncbi:hypothetical protein pb186bvf_011274 [Paramecium bursaria]